MMTTEESLAPRLHDPIRVVPLHLPGTVTGPLPKEADEITGAATPAPTPPHLTYRNGPLLTNVQIYTVFWGAAWNTPTLHGLAGQINQFFQFIVTSSLMDELGEYSVTGHKIGHGTFLGTTTIPSPAPTSIVTDAAIQQFLQQEIANHTLPPHNPNLLYFIYTPPGVGIQMGGGSSCQAFCGYHNAIANQTFYAAMPYPGCSGCTGGMSILDALTGTSSHEMCEAITDPVPGTGWYDNVHGEIGDICAWKFKRLGPWNVQLEWSNKANNCI